MTPAKQSLIQINIAVILFGGTTLFSKLISMPASNITFFRALIGCIALATFILLRSESFKLANTKEYLWVIVIGLIMGVHWVAFFHSMQVSTIAIGIVAMFTFPVMTALVEPLVDKCRYRPSDFICALAVLGGIILIVPEFTFENNVVLGLLCGCLAAAGITARNIIVRKKLKHIPSIVCMWYQLLITFLMLLPFISFEYDLMADNRLWYLILLGIFFTAIPHSLIVASLKNLRATTVSFISCMQPFYGIVIAAIAIGEIPELKVLVGGGIIIATALYESKKAAREPVQEQLQEV
mgnify:CR=1 FL=1